MKGLTDRATDSSDEHTLPDWNIPEPTPVSEQVKVALRAKTDASFNQTLPSEGYDPICLEHMKVCSDCGCDPYARNRT